MRYHHEWNLHACISSVIHRESGFLDYRYLVKCILEKYQIEGIRNYEDIRPQSNFEAEIRDSCDLFVLLLGSRISKVVKNELEIAMRRGVPTMVFIKTNYDKKGQLHMPKNTKDFLVKNYPGLYFEERIYFDTIEKLGTLLEDQLKVFLKQKYNISPVIGLDPPVAYTEGVKLLVQARHRIVLVQRSSIFLLGPRNGNAPEKVFYGKLMEWLGRGGEGKYFLHYFSRRDTSNEMKTKDYDISEAKKRALNILKSGNMRCILRASDKLQTVTNLICDTGLGLNFYIGNNRYYLFLPCFLTKERELEGIVSSIGKMGKVVSVQEVRKLY